ncbi:MAG: hypothetical protein IPM64_01395 [Phycisphaerales bacterium]|nr:hypothetical protein [Phycisphaerales bacterium]
MHPIVWTKNLDGRDSLAAALRAAQPPSAAPMTIDDVTALLGLGAAFTADRSGCARHWSFAARDAAIHPAAALLGLRLRDLHPPDAAVGLSDSAEYPAHFADSYLPLIRRALAADQPVICWGGFEASAAPREWGILFELCNGVPHGHVPAAGAAIVPLIGPAHQVYVIESREAPPVPPAADLLACSAAAACAFASSRIEARHGICGTQAAYRVLIAGIESGRPCPACHDGGACAAAAVQALVHARRGQARWLRALGAHLGRSDLALAQDWSADAERVADLLMPLMNAETIARSAARPVERSRCGQMLYTASQIEARLTTMLSARVAPALTA